jgi:hypothetical protein
MTYDSFHMHPSRILFTGDSFRTANGEAAQLANVEWLERAIGGLLRALTGVPSQIAFPLAAADVTQFVALQSQGMGFDHWAKIFWQPASENLVSAVKEGCKDSLVVSIEMPPVLEGCA